MAGFRCPLTAPLVASVCNAGGLGTLASVGLGEFEPDIFTNYAVANARALQKEIRRTRRMTDRPFAVNIMCALTDYEALVKICVEEKVEVIVSGVGLPLKLPEYVDIERTKLVPMVSSARAAELICKAWDKKYNLIPDAIIVEGPESGGHQGFSFQELENIELYSLESILQKVAKSIKVFEEKHNRRIPLVAAGGIFSAQDISKHLNNGACGVQMG